MADTPDGLSALELDALWQEFHELVNMTSMELGAWLGALPDGADTAEGEHVLAILAKRRAELTGEDLRTMYAVVEEIEDGSPGTDPGARRERLMALGHDPRRS